MHVPEGCDELVDSDDRKKRLEALNRKPLSGGTSRAADIDGLRRKLRRPKDEPKLREQTPLLYRRDIPVQRSKAIRRREPADPHVDLAEAVPGRQIEVPEGGTAYLVTSPLLEMDREWQLVSRAFRATLEQERSHVREQLASLASVDRLAPADVVFVDLETTGLGGTAVFLIGSMVWDGQGLVVRQYLARDYSEERAIISLFLGDLAKRRLIVSFNGKSFDIPYVRVRAAATGLRFRADQGHFDLLHECRRAWGARLRDCKLQTLESCICGRSRSDDIPGFEIPEAYHAFVRTGNACEIAKIVRHNMLDLATLADLIAKLPPSG